MGRLLGKGKLTNADKVADEYNECAAEVKKEHPFIGQGALHQEVMKRLAQRKAAEQAANQTNEKNDFTPQRIVPFRRRPRSNSIPQNSNSPNQSISRSFIGFLSSSASSFNTMKTSNKSSVTDFQQSNNNIVIAGRRTTVNDEDDVHTTMYAMRDIELSDGDDLSSDRRSKSSRSSLGSKLSSLKSIDSLEGKKQNGHSTQIRRSSSNSSMSSLQQCSSDVSKEDTIVENSVDPKTSEGEEPQHIDNVLKEEQEVMEFVEEFLARGGSVKPKGKQKRRSSLLSVEENKELINTGGSVTKSIATIEGNSVSMATGGSLICSWGMESFNESELMAGDLICNWDSRQSTLSNSSASSRLAVAPNSEKLPSEIDVGNNVKDKS